MRIKTNSEKKQPLITYIKVIKDTGVLVTAIKNGRVIDTKICKLNINEKLCLSEMTK